MKTSKFILPISFLFILVAGRAAEQDNWYLAKEWPVTESRGIYYDHNSTTGEGRIFVGRGSVWDATGRDIKIYDTNGTLQNTFGNGNFMDLVMDEEGTLYTVSHNRVVAFSNSPGRVTSVTVDAPEPISTVIGATKTSPFNSQVAEAPEQRPTQYWR